jgi:general stress protein 26
MSDLTFADISSKMRSMDTTMLMTVTEDGRIAGRPLSNNQEVDAEGNSYYFTWGYSPMVQNIERQPNVTLAFQASAPTPEKLMRIHVQGRAEVIRDTDAFHEHWSNRLNHWFDRGPDTPGLVMIKVHAQRVHYWNGSCEGEIRLD